jgi:hypothetical protein
LTIQVVETHRCGGCGSRSFRKQVPYKKRFLTKKDWEEKYHRDVAVKCFNCLKEGHFARDCKEEKKKNVPEHMAEDQDVEDMENDGEGDKFDYFNTESGSVNS